MTATRAYCFGHISCGTIIRIADPFPEAEGYGEIIEEQENFSGEAASTAVVLAKLGVSVSLEGNWIGDTPLGRRNLAFLQDLGIDCSRLHIEPGYQGATELVISDGATRTVFGRYRDLLGTTRQWTDPSSELIGQAQVVCIDPNFGATTDAAVSIAAAAHRPIVAIDTSPDSSLHRAAAVTIISGEYRRWQAPTADAARLFEQYLATSKGLVVFTFGAEPLWYGRNDRTAMPVLTVSVTDTAGAGDSFRAGVVYGMLQGWDDEVLLRWACAVAALTCTTAPGVLGFPGRTAVEELLQRHDW